ncbi:Dps family protein [Ferruginibacter sp.]|uniref:Dps family protein n=1 Tax=Ferruginibacter sp. TaxID=1940288 RepID=UPI0019875A76|nr:DNA starvation/stationary phase protection protein [Ferruginibacter sp.]MBC7627573.1 DNA starvation/stationary phase protection protein [Ferruginibacter sp.]
MKANIGLSDKNSKEIAGVLNKILADEYLLYTKTRNYHWNIEGSNFTEMHLFYESQYNTIDEAIDEVAERVRQIGHYAQGRLKDFIKQSQLVEQEYSTDQKTQIQNLLDDHEAIIRFLRLHIDVFTSKYKDAGNADFVTGLMERHEKMAWFLRSYLK